MKIYKQPTPEEKQEVIELFSTTNNNTTAVIADTTGLRIDHVSRIINDYLEPKQKMLIN